MMIKLELTEQEVNIIALGLNELKLKDALPVFVKIKEQVDTQTKDKE